MIYFENYLVMLILFLNLSIIVGITIAKLIYKNEYDVKIVSNLSICLGIIFVLYTISLIVFSISLAIYGRHIAGLLILLTTIIPFIIGKISSYQESDFFIDLQLVALIINVFIICAT